jgi:putative MATE family efflux protein
MFKYGLVLKDRDFIKKVMVVAIPMILQQTISSSVNLLDNLMIGQLGEFAIAGVATSNKFFMISSFAMMGIIQASTIFLAQAYGAKKEELMKQSFRYGLVCSLLIVLLFSNAAWIFPEQIIQFFSPNEPGLLDAALKYIPVAALTFFPQAVSFAITSSMRAVGETKIPLVSSVISLSANAVMNYVLIFGHFGFPRLGILGAAIGTLIARILELIFLLYAMHIRHFPFSTKIKDVFNVHTKLRKAITIKAIPLLLNEIGWSAGMAMLFKFYATRGTDALAALPIASTTGDLFFVLFSGMAVATTVMVSHPLGSNDLEEARENGYKMLQLSILLSLVFAVGLLAASFITPQLYNVSDKVRNMATNLIRIQGLFFFIYMHNAQSFFVIRAGGDTRSTLIMDAGFMWFINLPVVGFFSYMTNYNIFVLYIAGQITDIIKMFVTSYYFRKEHWVKNLTHEEDLLPTGLVNGSVS